VGADRLGNSLYLLLLLLGVVACGLIGLRVFRLRRKSPRVVAQRLVRWTSRGKHERRWTRLHPVHRSLIPREQFVAAESDAIFPRYTRLQVISESDWTVTIPAVGQRIVREVRIRAWYGERDETLSILLANVSGDWYWMVDQSTLNAYRESSAV
jgi:hypothetical protein